MVSMRYELADGLHRARCPIKCEDPPDKIDYDMADGITPIVERWIGRHQTIEVELVAAPLRGKIRELEHRLAGSAYALIRPGE